MPDDDDTVDLPAQHQPPQPLPAQVRPGLRAPRFPVSDIYDPLHPDKYATLYGRMTELIAECHEIRAVVRHPANDPVYRKFRRLLDDLKPELDLWLSVAQQAEYAEKRLYDECTETSERQKIHDSLLVVHDLVASLKTLQEKARHA